MATDKPQFFELIAEHEPHVDPCFMTGKRCVYCEAIEQERTSRKNKLTGFLIRPFEPNLRAFFDLCFKPYLKKENESEGKLELELTEADTVRKTGYIICEKICKKIQESNFVVADVSIPNPNVFYELGLAYGAGQKILVVYQEDSAIGKSVADTLHNAGCKAIHYKSIDDPGLEGLQLSDHIWERKQPPSMGETMDSRIVLLAAECDSASSHDTKDIHISFCSHISLAVKISIDNIVARRKAEREGKEDLNSAYIKNLSTLKPIEENSSFNSIVDEINESYCVIIRTGYKEATSYMSYFWLGYCHAIGKNTIPIAIVDTPTDKVEDLAFDIRSLWYMTFARKSNPLDLHKEMQDVLQQMIETDFSHWHHKTFWRQILGKKGEVSIFTGAIHWDHPGRDMIGDWDLRAVSSLTSSLAVHDYRAIIESPVYQIEHFLKQTNTTKKEYCESLRDKLNNKNCIIIASAEVNPMTEICLGKLYDIDQEYWFTDKNIYEDREYAVVGVKGATSMPSDKAAQDYTGRLFSTVSQNATDKPGDKEHRGFKSHRFPHLPLEGFLSQEDPPADFSSYAHLLIAKNPFGNDKNKFLVILNGISGPATFALTQIIAGTGVMGGSMGASTVSKEFVAYKDNFKPDEESEQILSEITKGLPSIMRAHSTGLQYLFKVEIGPSKTGDENKKPVTDWRRIAKWERWPKFDHRFLVISENTQDSSGKRPTNEDVAEKI